jgi:hypothetical protein
MDDGTTTINENWSDAHLAVTNLMTALLNILRDLGYNPSHHISYNQMDQHLVLDESVVKRHAEVESAYEKYLKACEERQLELERVQQLPKLDIGFSAE